MIMTTLKIGPGNMPEANPPGFHGQDLVMPGHKTQGNNGREENRGRRNLKKNGGILYKK